MKKTTKKITAILIAIFMVLSFAGCGEKVPEPEVTEGSFPFSVTYTLNGEEKVLSDTLVCEFVEAGKTIDGFYREWSYIFENKQDKDSAFAVFENELGTLYIETYCDVRYFMADPFYSGSEELIPDAFFTFTDEEYEKRGIGFTDDFTDLGFEFSIVSWQYPDPVENEYK